MQLTTHTDYALRLLVYLFVHEGGPVSVKRVAGAYGISSNHLAKVAAELVRLGWIRSRRGNGGGLSLQPAARELSVGDVVRGLEHNLRIVECFGANNTCPIAPACELKVAFREASEAFLRVLDGYSLVQITRHPTMLRELLAASC